MAKRQPSRNGGKTADGKFAPGNKFGRGRPDGSRNKASLAAEALLDGEGETIVRKAIELAKSGDTTALRLCIERLVPTRRDRPIEVEIPPINDASDIPRAISAVIDAVARGEITSAEAQGFTAVIESYRRAVETVELAARLTNLEDEIARDKGPAGEGGKDTGRDDPAGPDS